MGEDVTDVDAVEGKKCLFLLGIELRFLSSIMFHVLNNDRAIGNKNLFLETT